MNEDYRDLDRRVSHNSRDSLVERLDPALGEASSGIGVLLSELVRRTLRGGVAKIEEEMEEFVEEKLDVAIEKSMPEFQEAATRTAEAKAREIAHDEVEVVGREARESARRLEEESKAAAEKLAQEIAETERRAEARAQELLSEHLDDLKQKSKNTYQQVRSALDELTHSAAALETRIAQEEKARDAGLVEMRQLVEQLQSRNAQLETRIAELEKPRGLRALWARLFGRKKKNAVASADGDSRAATAEATASPAVEQDEAR